MKNRTDKILLAVFVVSIAVYAAVIAFGFESTLGICMILSLHAVPAFCLQLLLCRKVRRWVAVFPALLTTGTALWSTYGYFTSTGWDALGYAILMALSIAPAVGCALAWRTYFYQLRKRGTVHG